MVPFYVGAYTYWLALMNRLIDSVWGTLGTNWVLLIEFSTILKDEVVVVWNYGDSRKDEESENVFDYSNVLSRKLSKLLAKTQENHSIQFFQFFYAIYISIAIHRKKWKNHFYWT